MSSSLAGGKFPKRRLTCHPPTELRDPVGKTYEPGTVVATTKLSPSPPSQKKPTDHEQLCRCLQTATMEGVLSQQQYSLSFLLSLSINKLDMLACVCMYACAYICISNCIAPCSRLGS